MIRRSRWAAELTHRESERFFVTGRWNGEEAVVELGGECDASTLDELNGALDEVLAQKPHAVVVDLTQVTFVDSMTLGTLMAAAKRVRSGGGSFGVVGATATEVRRSFDITGLDKFLLIQ